MNKDECYMCGRCFNATDRRDLNGDCLRCRAQGGDKHAIKELAGIVGADVEWLYKDEL